MRLSCADSAFPKLSRAAALAVIADLGIEGVDVCVFGIPDVSLFSLDDVIESPTRSAASVKAVVSAADLEIADVFGILSADFRVLAVNHPEADERAEARRRALALLDFVSEAGGSGLTLLPGVPWDGEDRERSRARAAEELQWRGEEAKRRGLGLSVEPHYESIIETPQETLQLLGSAPDVTIALDPSHFVYQGFGLADIEPLIERARHVQARQAAKGSMQLPLKDGTIDFAQFIEMLEQHGYEGWFCVEYQWEEWLGCYTVDCVSETALMRDVFVSAHVHR